MDSTTRFPLNVTELTISTFHEALHQQTFTCSTIIRTYLDRITRYEDPHRHQQECPFNKLYQKTKKQPTSSRQTVPSHRSTACPS